MFNQYYVISRDVRFLKILIFNIGYAPDGRLISTINKNLKVLLVNPETVDLFKRI